MSLNIHLPVAYTSLVLPDQNIHQPLINVPIISANCTFDLLRCSWSPTTGGYPDQVWLPPMVHLCFKSSQYPLQFLEHYSPL